MSGISLLNFEMFQSLCGTEALENVIIVTNMWPERHEAGRQEAVFRENELKSSPKFFQPAIEAKARVMRHFNNRASAERILSAIVPNTPKMLLVTQEMYNPDVNLAETEAGMVLESQHQEVMDQYEQKLASKHQELSEENRRFEMQNSYLEMEKRKAEDQRYQAERDAASWREKESSSLSYKSHLESAVYHLRQQLNSGYNSGY